MNREQNKYKMKEDENIPELDGAGFDADGNDNYQPNKYYNQFRKAYNFDAYGKEKFLEDVAIAVTDHTYGGRKFPAGMTQQTVDNIIDLIRPILKDYETKNNTIWKS